MNVKPWLLAALLPCTALANSSNQGALSIALRRSPTVA
ncbi:hypothetical protein GLGCALEP_03129 [Pseudomonas sp. MM221]|nr:hypothetical protein GLGCALEP_03129 [Pseudomonas sp. MM221]